MAIVMNLARYIPRCQSPNADCRGCRMGNLDVEKRTDEKQHPEEALHRMGPDPINLKRQLKMKMAEIGHEAD